MEEKTYSREDIFADLDDETAEEQPREAAAEPAVALPAIYRFCKTAFETGGSAYFRTEDDSLRIGDIVVVPGEGDETRLAVVISVEDHIDSDLPLPLAEARFILGRKESEPAEEANPFVEDLSGDELGEELLERAVSAAAAMEAAEAALDETGREIGQELAEVAADGAEVIAETAEEAADAAEEAAGTVAADMEEAAETAAEDIGQTAEAVPEETPAEPAEEAADPALASMFDNLIEMADPAREPTAQVEPAEELTEEEAELLSRSYGEPEAETAPEAQVPAKKTWLKETTLALAALAVVLVIIAIVIAAR